MKRFGFKPKKIWVFKEVLRSYIATILSKADHNIKLFSKFFGSLGKGHEKCD